MPGRTAQEGGRSRVGVLHPQHRRVTVGVLVMVLIHAVGAMGASTVMPLVVADLGSVTSYAWMFSGYTGASILGIAIAGRLCDRLGPRRPFLLSVGVLAAGQVVTGLSLGFPMFVLGRVLQGFSGGLYAVTMSFIIAREYPEDLRPRMFGLMPTAWGVAALAGPQLGALVAESWSWRALFLGVALLLPVALAIAFPALADSPAGAGDKDAEQRLPLAAILAVTFSLALLHLAGQHLTRVSVGLLLVAGPLLAAFLPRLFPSRTVRRVPVGPSLIAARSLLAASFAGVNTFVPLMLVQERGLPPAMAGTALTATALAWAVGGGVQSRLGRSLPHLRFLQVGCVSVAIGLTGQTLALLDQLSPYTAVVFSGVGGFGMGLASASISVLLFQQVPEGKQGTFAALLQLGDSLGYVAALAVTGGAFAFLHAEPGRNGTAFTAIFVISSALAAAATAVAVRFVPRATPPADRVP